MKTTNLLLGALCFLHLEMAAQSVWQPLAPPVRDWSQVAVAGPDVMYAANKIWGADMATILVRSNDGGTTWDSVNTYYISPFGLEFWDENNGHMLGGIPSCGLFAGMMNITDGGQTLIERQYYNEFYSIGTANLQTNADNYADFYLSGWSGAVYHTLDTGATLTPVLSLGDDYRLHLSDVKFVNPMLGFACGYREVYNPDFTAYTNTGLIYRTTDAGANWALDSFENAKISNSSFLDEQFGFALSGTKLLRTTDGGLSWMEQILPFDAANFQVIDALHIFTIDALGDVWETTDAGNSWQNGLSGYKINDIQCAHNQCLIGGDSGAMFKTTYFANTVIEPIVAFGLSPNPANGSVLFVSETTARHAYKVFDMAGKMVAEGHVSNGERIAINELPNATYFCTFAGLGSCSIVVVK